MHLPCHNSKWPNQRIIFTPVRTNYSDNGCSTRIRSSSYMVCSVPLVIVWGTNRNSTLFWHRDYRVTQAHHRPLRPEPNRLREGRASLLQHTVLLCHLSGHFGLENPEKRMQLTRPWNVNISEKDFFCFHNSLQCCESITSSTSSGLFHVQVIISPASVFDWRYAHAHLRQWKITHRNTNGAGHFKWAKQQCLAKH